MAIALIVGLTSGASAKPVGLEAVDVATRVQFYSALAGVGGALLGFVIAALAILVALPDSATVRSLRTYRGWRVLQLTLLATAFDLLIVVGGALFAIVSDGAAQGAMVTGYAFAAGLGVLVSTTLFALVLANLVVSRA